MKITDLKVKNFLSFGESEQEIQFDKQNTIVGPNDAGKTNVFRAISVVYDFLKNLTLDPDPYYHNADLTKPLEIQLGIKLENEENEVFSNFVFCSMISEQPNVKVDENRERANSLVEEFAKKYGKKIASDLFEKFTIIIKRREDRLIYKGDHLLKLGKEDMPLYLESYGLIKKEQSHVDSEYRLPDIILEEIRKKNPTSVTNYISKKSNDIPQIDFSEKEIGDFFAKLIHKRSIAVNFQGFRLGEGRLKGQNYSEAIKLREFLVNRSYTDYHINIIELIALIFTNSIIRTSDMRSKPNSYLSLETAETLKNLHLLSGENLPAVLFELKNSTKPSLIRRYNKIREKFKTISDGLEFDIGIKSHKIKKKTGTWVVPLPEHETSSRRDNVIPAGIQQDETETIENELLIRFMRGDLVIPLDFASTGRFETLLLLTALIGQTEKVILLDEPASNMHPALQKRILEVIEETVMENRNQVLTITHSPYMINPERLKNVWRVAFDNYSSQIINIKQAIGSLEKNEENKIINQLFDSEIRSILFSKGVVLVEGPSDKIVVEKVDKYLSFNGKGANLDDEDWTVIEIGGKDSLSSFIKLTKFLNLPFMAVLDNDALMRCEKKLKTTKNKISTSSILFGLYNSGILNDGHIDKIKDVEKSIETIPVFDEKKKKNSAQFWYPEKHRQLLTKIANSHNVFVFSKDLENALQNPVKRNQSKPLKDYEAVIDRIKQNKIPSEFYEMEKFIKARLK